MLEKSAGPKGSGVLQGRNQHTGTHCGPLSAQDKDAGCCEASKQC